MQNLPEIGDVVMINSNNTIWADEKGFFIITKLDKNIRPIEIVALTKSKTHEAGAIIRDKQLINYIYPIMIKASSLINKESLFMADNKFESLPIVHFIGNNREIKFLFIDDKLESNIEFEFYFSKTQLKKCRIVIDLPKKIKSNFFKKLTHPLIKMIFKINLKKTPKRYILKHVTNF